VDVSKSGISHAAQRVKASSRRCHTTKEDTMGFIKSGLSISLDDVIEAPETWTSRTSA
jgi:hypothetical protein